MTDGTFADGYRDGWATVAGDAPLPERPTFPPKVEWNSKTAFLDGFEYGRADALERFKPTS